MNNIIRIDSINDFVSAVNQKAAHPLISILDFAKMDDRPEIYNIKIVMGFYGIMYKESKQCNVKYGRNYYDYQQGTMIFFGPEQVVEFEQNTQSQFGI